MPTTPKRKPGRPRTAGPTVQLSVRIHPDAREQLDALTELWACTIGQALERTLNDAATRVRLGVFVTQRLPE